ncbi:MAG TPA: hypothetical protein VM369_09025, partial [Candidatus Binatia bacterium]|nr:hypothetical protein [Candidatus Binatia bacterium]
MRHARLRAAAWLLSMVAALAGCATLPPEIPQAAACRATFLELDRRTADAGVRDGGAHRIEGFPYLRSDRLLASFRDEVADGAAFDTWVEHLRQLDLDARRVELRNLGESAGTLTGLDRCGAHWAQLDLASPGRRAQLRRAAQVPDDYSMTRRALGLYPLVAALLNLGISGYHRDVREDFARPLEVRDDLVLWQLAGNASTRSMPTGMP